MSCVIPIRIINPHYRKIADEQNEDVYTYESHIDFYIDVPCGQCINCLKQRGSSWSLRLNLEYKYLTPVQQRNSYFVTLTLSDDYINEDKSMLIRRFLERIRKKCKRSVKHWIINEFGENTQRYHFHGILFDIPFPRHELLSYWKYGFIDIKPLTPRRVGYVTTYINKNLKGTPYKVQPPELKQTIWCSPGLGKQVVNDKKVTNHLHVNDRPTPFMYNLSNRIQALPRYLRQKFFTPDELEDIQQAYYQNISEDVIPDPPYFIGTTKYTDYTIYLKDCEKLRRQRLFLNKRFAKKQSTGYNSFSKN